MPYRSGRNKLITAIALAMALLLPVPGLAQRDTAGVRADPRSPRAAIAEFLTLARAGQFVAAGRFLGPGVEEARRTELTRRLKAVLDRHLWIETDYVSPLAAGDTADGLQRVVDRLGTIRNEIGVPLPVDLRQQSPPAEPAWVFAPQTVSRIDMWYDALADHWIRDRMPMALQRPGPFGIDVWQWVTLALLIPVAIAIGWLSGRITVSVARRAARRTETMVDDRLLERTRTLVLAVWAVIAYRVLVEPIGLSIGAERVVGVAVMAVLTALIVWLFVRTTHVLEEELPASRWAAEKPDLRAVAPLVGRVLRVFVVALGAIAIVAQFGYSVVTLITGLGIGGIALALAAQKSLEHMFGSVAIGMDQPIRIGDWIRVGNTEGEVEAIGLRSTRIRTQKRSLVAIPNGRLAEMEMENFGARDRILLRTEIGLVYGTTSAQIRRIRDEIEKLLMEHPLVWPDRVIVRFSAFGAHSLNIDVMVWLITTDYNVFRAAREEILLKLMDVVEREGSAFAFPTQTVVLEDARRISNGEIEERR